MSQDITSFLIENDIRIRQEQQDNIYGLYP